MEAPGNNFLEQKWYVVLDDLVGGWAVANVDKPLSAHNYEKGERHWIECFTKELAEYLVEFHNKNTGHL